ncbi:hypothetical protein CMV_023067 [Castanea mollissima]|uniref:Uncharacterized protein n=1 Tax=Castanea mollissima TaxID=60419 RepID=A0A8J4QGQ9_9ROSI|nr:hypothetical protein CMV_023067 [Castanea mollissima]
MARALVSAIAEELGSIIASELRLTILDKVLYLSQIAFDQQINIYLVGSLFLTDKEDKINLKEETPSRTSRIQLRKEMNMILTPPLTKEIEEDDASQIYYMSKLIGEV